MKKTTIAFLLCFISPTLFAQNMNKEVADEVIDNSFYLGVETGITSFNAFEREYDFIREEASYYYGYYGNYSALSLTSFSSYAGINGKFRIFDEYIWVSGGVNYSTMNNSIAKSYGSDSHPDYFYVLLSRQEYETYYYRISEVKFKNHYLGIPLSINLAPLVTKYVKFYGKIETDLNFKIATSKRVTFYDVWMDKYEEQIIRLFEDPEDFYATAGIGGGMQIGKTGYINGRFEMDVATFILTPDAFALVNPNIGFGVSFSLLIPVK